jgi:hypothetical protein
MSACYALQGGNPFEGSPLAVFSNCAYVQSNLKPQVLNDPQVINSLQLKLSSRDKGIFMPLGWPASVPSKENASDVSKFFILILFLDAQLRAKKSQTKLAQLLGRIFIFMFVDG